MSRWALPEPLVQETLRRYADLLRVGLVCVNDEVVRWTSDTSKELQLQSFCEAFVDKLRSLKELSLLDDTILRLTSYWVCKAFSINYALHEVLSLIQRRIGMFCTIETRQDGGGTLVSYSVEATASHRLAVKMRWRGKDNVLYFNALSGQKQVKGTIRCFETDFGLPPDAGFAPLYRLQMLLKSRGRFPSKVACASALTSRDEALPEEPLQVDQPLASEVEAALQAADTLPPSSPRAKTLASLPRSLYARTVRLTESTLEREERMLESDFFFAEQ
mmetsp:Transcript_29395/g.55051  ORF Transcript_29395/g.55051 Transcript_29395/m.55051 type:complete len:275 (+) Transcript_29395:60-884(+)